MYCRFLSQTFIPEHSFPGLAEKHLAEALDSLQSEREQKYLFKKELDQRDQAAAHSGNIAGLRLELGEGSADDKIRPSTVGDLFSELHLTEIRKLEKQLETMELEKESLTKTLDDSKQELEQMRSELEDRKNKLLLLGQRIDAIVMQAENVSAFRTDILRMIGTGINFEYMVVQCSLRRDILGRIHGFAAHRLIRVIVLSLPNFRGKSSFSGCRPVSRHNPLIF